MTKNLTHGQTVEVTFNKVDECDGSGNFPTTCYLNHSFEAWVEITQIE